MLKKENRLSEQELKVIFSERKEKVIFSENFKVLIFQNRENLKVGVILPKKFFGNRSAAKRNKIRRKIFSLFEKHKEQNDCKIYLFMFKNSRTKSDILEIIKETEQFFANSIKNEDF
jgi:ribonuclease P protein component